MITYYSLVKAIWCGEGCYTVGSVITSGFSDINDAYRKAEYENKEYEKECACRVEVREAQK